MYINDNIYINDMSVCTCFGVVYTYMYIQYIHTHKYMYIYIQYVHIHYIHHYISSSHGTTRTCRPETTNSVAKPTNCAGRPQTMTRSSMIFSNATKRKPTLIDIS